MADDTFDTLVYKCTSLADMPVRVPANAYNLICRYLEGKENLSDLKRFPTLRRFLHHMEALVDVCIRFGFDWRKAAAEVGLSTVADYFVLRFCEIQLFQAQRKAKGDLLAKMLQVYSVISETCRRIENRAITEAIRLDMRMDGKL